MKKVLLIGLAVVLISAFGMTGVAMAAPPVLPDAGFSTHSTAGTQNVLLRVKVLKYLAVNPTYQSLTSTWASCATIDPGDTGVIPPGGLVFSHPGVFFMLPSPGFWAVFAYANCPFNVSVSAMAPLRRHERDYSWSLAPTVRLDYLYTHIKHIVQVNLPGTAWDYQRETFAFQGVPNPGGGWTGGWNKTSDDFTTPHNGLIIGLVRVTAAADPPSFAGPLTKHFGLSQDAGRYATSYTVTYSAL